MTYDEVMAALEAAGTAQARKTYERHGVTGAMFGVSYAVLGKLQKKIKSDHALALRLWASGNHDARVLATMVADPVAMTARELEEWLGSCGNYALVDAVAKVAAGSPQARAMLDRWIAAPREWTSAAGWSVLAWLLREGDAALRPDVLGRYLETIERHIQSAPNRTRHSMNGALIAIGGTSEAMARQATAAAKRIGKVEVDHGDTACETPDAASYIAKVRGRVAARAAKAGKPARTIASKGTKQTAKSKSVRLAKLRK